MASELCSLNVILGAARALGLRPGDFAQLGPSRWASVYDAVLEHFTVAGLGNRMRLWLWQDFVEPNQARPCDSNDLKMLANLAAPTERLFLLLEKQEMEEVGVQARPLWVLEGTLEAIIQVLGEIPLCEYYLVDKKFNWLLAETHHDVRIAVGEHAIQCLEAGRETRSGSD